MSLLFRLVTAAFLAVSLAAGATAGAISPPEAAHHVGQTITVEGVVAQVSKSRKGTTFINFGGRFPNQLFQVVIFNSDSHRFSNIAALEGRAVAITGEIKMYNGTPEIILRYPSQIDAR